MPPGQARRPSWGAVVCTFEKMTVPFLLVASEQCQWELQALLEHPSSECARMLLLLMTNTATGSWHSALPCASAPHHSILHPRKLYSLVKKPEEYSGSLSHPHIHFLVLVLRQIQTVPPSTTQRAQLGVMAGWTVQIPHGSSILSWGPSCEQQPASQPLPTQRC